MANNTAQIGFCCFGSKKWVYKLNSFINVHVSHMAVSLGTKVNDL